MTMETTPLKSLLRAISVTTHEHHPPLKIGLNARLLFGSTLLLTNCAGNIENSGYADTGGYYSIGVYGYGEPDLYILGDGFYGGRSARNDSRRRLRAADGITAEDLRRRIHGGGSHVGGGSGGHAGGGGGCR